MARLVYDVTDISTPADGNRAAHKLFDRDHIAQGPPRAKTIKLADLIDNCRDICKHDPRFARVYLVEMAALLEVLQEGDAVLLKRARRELSRCADRLGLDQPPGSMGLDEQPPELEQGLPQRSFDTPTPRRIGAAGVREDGIVAGYLRFEDLAERESGVCGTVARRFSRDQVVASYASLTNVIFTLRRHSH